MRLLTRAAALSLAAFTIVAGLANPAHADPYPCDQQCQWQWAQQRQNALPRTDFYDSPRPLPWAPAGRLIRAQDTTDYQIDGVPRPATRILYHSRAGNGDDVAASAVILTPPGPSPAGGWPVVVDAHGTSGYGRDCAPSLMRDLYHGNQMVRFVEKGWAVVAPDYAGLGTEGHNEFINKTAEANDLINAVRSARQARAGLSRRWIVWGHSQGGGAALGLAEQLRSHPDPGYLGAVVTAPAADLPAALTHLVAQPGMGGFVPLVAAGAHATDPQLDVSRILTSTALDRIAVVDNGCLGVVFAVYADLNNENLVRPGYQSIPGFRRFLRDNSAGRHAVAGPVLLLQGDADSVIPAALTTRVAGALCRQGARLDYRTYPGLEHDTYPGVVTGIDDGAMPDILAWTADRFAGKPAATTCR